MSSQDNRRGLEDVTSSDDVEARNDQYTSDQHWLNDKERLIEEFKSVYRSKGPDDLVAQIPYLGGLGEIYLRKTKCSTENWTDFLKAHSLFNACAVRTEETDHYWDNQIYKTESLYYEACGRSHPLNKIRREKLMGILKKSLINIRDKMRTNMDDIDEMPKEISNQYKAENTLEKEYTDKVKELSCRCTEDMIKFAGRIIKESIELMGGQPPCGMAAVAMGSLARGEATPYSDLEYMFLIEDNTHYKYFEQLAITSYFLIGNLRETPLKYMNIEELEAGGWFTDKSKSGMKIDGLKEHAGNIPTGNGLSNSKSLINTPAEFFQNYKKSFDNPEIPEEGKPTTADMSNVLNSLVVIYHHGNGNDIVDDITRQIDKLEMNTKRKEYAIKMLRSDCDWYTFVPEGVGHSGRLEVKTDLYRFITIVLFDLKLLTKTKAQNSWMTVDKIARLCSWSQMTSHAISTLLSVAMHIRLSCYLFYDSQTEGSSVYEAYDQGAKGMFHINRQTFHLMAKYLLPVKRALTAVLALDEELRLSELSVNIDDAFTMMSVHAYCMEWDRCLSIVKEKYGDTIHDAVEGIEKDLSVLVGSEMIHLVGFAAQNCAKHHEASVYYRKALDMQLAIYGENTAHPSIATSYNNIGLLHETMENYHDALEYYEKALYMRLDLHSEDTAHPHIATVYNNIGLLCKAMGNYSEALDYCKKALDTELAVYGKNTAHPNIATTHNNIGSLYEAIGSYHGALECYKKALDMQLAMYGENTAHPNFATSYNNIGLLHNAMGNHYEALEYCKEALDMLLTFYDKNTAHPHIANSYNNIGLVYQAIGSHHEALEYHKKALDMRLAIYGKSAAHSDITISYNNIGLLYKAMGNYYGALEYYEKALDMRLAIYGKSAAHPNIARSYDNIGLLHKAIGNYHEALENYKEALNMWLTIYGKDTLHPCVARTYNNIGLLYKVMGNHHEALKYYKIALDMWLANFGENTSHPDIATSYNNIGLLHQAMGSHHEALKYYKKALCMWKTIYSKNPVHSNIAVSYNNIGFLYKAMGNHHDALEYFNRALNMQLSIHGKNTAHPYTAAIYKNIGSLHEAMGNHHDALEYYKESLDMLLAIYGKSSAHPNIAATYQSIGLLYYAILITAVCKNTLNEPPKAM